MIITVPAGEPAEVVFIVVERRPGAPSGEFAENAWTRLQDVQRGNGQAMTLSGAARHVDHEFAAELGMNGLPGWMGGFTPTRAEEAGPE